jgi:hypothetical protein
MDNDSTNADRIRSMGDSPGRILKHCPPQATALVATIYSEPG